METGLHQLSTPLDHPHDSYDNSLSGGRLTDFVGKTLSLHYFPRSLQAADGMAELFQRLIVDFSGASNMKLVSSITYTKKMKLPNARYSN